MDRATIDVEAASAYVRGRRTLEGGYCFYRTPSWGVEEPNAPDTLAALGSLRLLEVAPAQPHQTADWLLSLQAPGGGYATLTIGWASLRALALLGRGPERSPDSWLSAWSEQLLEERPTRQPRPWLLELLRLAELFELRGVTPDRARLTRLLERSVAAHGGWPRDAAELETTGVVSELIRRARLEPVAARSTVAFLQACEDPALGLRTTPDAAATTVGALWGGVTVARNRLQALRHPEAIAASIALLQRRDGGFGERHRALTTLRDTWLALRAWSTLAELQAPGSAAEKAGGGGSAEASRGQPGPDRR